jgi:hypothetical protein
MMILSSLWWLGKIGPAVASVFIGLVAYSYYSRNLRHQWIQNFQALYAEFWTEKDHSDVRSWIVSNQLYEKKLRHVLEARNNDGRHNNNRDEDENIVLDKVDRFCSIQILLYNAQGRNIS